MNKTMSPEQVEANRRNAQKSTGPKTEAGKAVAKMNAMKHGILSKQVLVQGLNLNESSRELSGLHQRFWQELNPVGPVEEMLVDQIVTAHWRWRRALTAEAGEIALSVDGGAWERQRPLPGLTLARWEIHGDPVFAMQDSMTGIRFLERWLKEVREAVVKEGELSEGTVRHFLACFGGRPNVLTRQLEELCLRVPENPGGLATEALRGQQQQRVLDFVDQELRSLSLTRPFCQEREEKEEAARQAAAVLPSLETLERILRYETKLERQLYRAMNQLERLQRRRQGEAVPPPMTMDVSERP